MNIEEKLAELNAEKVAKEFEAKQYQIKISELQQLMANLNKDYLILLGEIKAYEEMNKEE